MLRPPLRIFIAHRHQSHEFKHAEEAVQNCKDNGFRIEAVYINEKSLRYSTNFPGKIQHELDNSNIALVLLSEDERISGEKQKVPPLAVMYEWGYLSSVMGKSRNDAIQILRSPNVKTGDIDPAVQYISMHEDTKHFTEWLESYLRDKWQMVPAKPNKIRTQTTVDDGDLGLPSMTERDLMAFFDHEMNSITNTEEIILYIYERIFFDVYFDDKEFWRRRIRKLFAKDVDDQSRDLLNALSCILEYTSGLWRQREASDLTINDQTSLYMRYRELLRIDEALDFQAVDPIYSIVIKNYLGLLESRGEISPLMPPNRIANAFNHFDYAIELAKKFEVGTVRFWQGFLSANIAKLISSNASAKKDIEHYRANLNSALILARDARKQWLEAEIQMPHFLRDIFLSEYFSALKSLSTNYNGNGGRFKKHFDNEFSTWENSTQASRFVRIKKIFDSSIKSTEANQETSLNIISVEKT